MPDVAAALPRWQGKTLWARDRAAPLREFVRTEAASALMLVAGIVVAIIWANVSDASYESFWHTRFYLGVGSAGITQDLRTWLNSGLMTLFFLVVGLETRRELDLGDLRERRRFVLPIITGLLGMAFPVAIYLAFNAGRPGAHGWVWPCPPTPRWRWACWPCSAVRCRTGCGCSCSSCSWSTTWARCW